MGNGKRQIPAIFSKKKSNATYLGEKVVFDDLKEFCPTLSHIREFNILLIESFLSWLKAVKHNSENTLIKKTKDFKSLCK
jgi:hypothetical protein